MDELYTDNTAANVDATDASMELATPTTTEETNDIPTDEDVTAAVVETATPEDDVPAEQPLTETQAFARRLAEKTAEAEAAVWNKVNPLIASLGGTFPDGTPIETFEDLQRAMELQELAAQAAQQNIPVEVLSRLTQAEKDALEAKSMLSEYQRKEALTKEAETLSADPLWGDFYKSNADEIRNVANQAGVDLSTAKLIVYDRIGPQKVDEEAIASKAIQEYIEGKRTSYKPVEGSGASPAQVVQTPKTFEEARDGARAMLRSLREK